MQINEISAKKKKKTGLFFRKIKKCMIKMNKMNKNAIFGDFFWTKKLFTLYTTKVLYCMDFSAIYMLHINCI